MISQLIVMFCLMLVVFFGATRTALTADYDSPVFSAANAAYSNARQALTSTSLEGIRTFAVLAMNAAQNLQAQALADGNETLASFAQGAYNNSKRASMSLSIEQAHGYTEQAVAFAQRARQLLGEFVDEAMGNVHRTNANLSLPDPARDVYYHGVEGSGAR